MVEWWRFGGRGSSWVDLDQHKWDSDPRGLVGMDLVVVDVDGGSGGGSGGGWFGFWIWNLDFVWVF